MGIFINSDYVIQHKEGVIYKYLHQYKLLGCWCLTAPSHYLNQCWLIINKVQWYLSKSNFTQEIPQPSSLKLTWKLLIYNFISNLSGANELNHRSSWARMDNYIPYKSKSVHDDVIKGKHFPCYWPFVRGIHRSPVNSPHKGQWRGALMFSLICLWINYWINSHEAGDLRRYRAHYDVIVMWLSGQVTGLPRGRSWVRS